MRSEIIENLKTMIRNSTIITLCLGSLLVGGCAQLDSLTGRFYEPQITNHTNTVSTPLGPVDVVLSRTNWVVSSGSRAAAELPGQLNVPFGSLITFLALSALSIGASLRSKKYKEATISALDCGNQLKEELKKHNIEISGIMKSVVKDQKSRGTFSIIRKLLDLI